MSSRRNPPPPVPRDLREEIGKVEPFALPEQEVYLNLVMTHDVLAGQHEQLFKEHGLSPPLYNILRILRGHERQASRRGKADHIGVPSLQVGREMITREPDITRLVDRLEKNGLVRRTRCAQDRRVVYVGLTEEGRHLADETLHPTLDLLRRQFAHLTPDELETLSRLLFKARHPGE